MDLEKEALVGMAGLIAENLIENKSDGWQLTSGGEKAAVEALGKLTRKEQQLVLLYAALVMRKTEGG